MEQVILLANVKLIYSHLFPKMKLGTSDLEALWGVQWEAPDDAASFKAPAQRIHKKAVHRKELAMLLVCGGSTMWLKEAETPSVADVSMKGGWNAVDGGRMF